MQTQELPSTERPEVPPAAPPVPQPVYQQAVPPMQLPVYQPAVPPVQQPVYPPAGPPVQPSAAQPDWRELRAQERLARRQHYHDAGVPFWGVLLIAVGAVALLGNLGLDFGWIFGLALGAWFVYLGARPYLLSQPINWWLVGLGLLIGLGAISTGFTDHLVFPVVLVLVGLGILGEQTMHRQNQPH